MDNKEKTTLTLNKENKESTPTTTHLARVEITLKLDNMPTKTQVSGKDTSFVVKDAKGHSYKVTCKTKTFNKSQKTVAAFKHGYVVSCNTKEFTINGRHVDMNQSGMQVFEKIPKSAASDATESTDPSTASNATESTDQPTGSNATESTDQSTDA